LVKREGEPLRTEVVGFTREEVFLSPLGEMKGIGPSSEVIPTHMPLHIKVGPSYYRFRPESGHFCRRRGR